MIGALRVVAAALALVAGYLAINAVLYAYYSR